MRSPLPHIRQRGRRSFAIVVNFPPHPDGRRNQKWISVKGTRKDAEQLRACIVHERDHGTLVNPSKMTFRQFLKLWPEKSVDAGSAPDSPPEEARAANGADDVPKASTGLLE